MPPTGSTFTDWQQFDDERRLLIDEDFSWSDPPARSRRRITEDPIRARRSNSVTEFERAVERDGRDQPTEVHSHFDEMMREWNQAYGDGAKHDGYTASEACPGDGRAYTAEGQAYAGNGHAYTADGQAHAGNGEAHAGDEVYAYDDGYVDDAAAAFDHDDLAGYSQAPVREDRSGGFDLSDPGSGFDASGRRTVVITGRGDDRFIPAPRRRAPSSELRFHERAGFSPDRTGLWAVLLGLALLIGCVVH
ncbi:MAG TPA: hypothetical protein VHV75_05600 [Solirubrobacteraceae bacterium]|jgi:hypothetical protein|nr:hypothetical protein [Solirubrobacteraceae bacterium]